MENDELPDSYMYNAYAHLLTKIHKIRDEKMDINTSKLNLIKKLNALTKAKDKEKAKEALDKTKDKTYNGIKGINEMVELIPFILSM